MIKRLRKCEAFFLFYCLMNTLLDFYEYDKFCNAESLKWINEYESDDQIIKLFSHILNAQHLWCCRILKKEYNYAVWEIHRKEAMPEILAENESYIEFVFSNYSNEDQFEYQNSKGNTYSSSFQEIMFHLFNHGNYHRGQINQLWRMIGVSPPLLDYIFWKRT